MWLRRLADSRQSFAVNLVVNDCIRSLRPSDPSAKGIKLKCHIRRAVPIDVR